MKSYWPICSICHKVVDHVELLPPKNTFTRPYVISCHGEKEESFIGIWAAFELDIKGKRLPDAFQSEKKKNENFKEIE